MFLFCSSSLFLCLQLVVYTLLFRLKQRSQWTNGARTTSWWDPTTNTTSRPRWRNVNLQTKPSKPPWTPWLTTVARYCTRGYWPWSGLLRVVVIWPINKMLLNWQQLLGLTCRPYQCQTVVLKLENEAAFIMQQCIFIIKMLIFLSWSSSDQQMTLESHFRDETD